MNYFEITRKSEALSSWTALVLIVTFAISPLGLGFAHAEENSAPEAEIVVSEPVAEEETEAAEEEVVEVEEVMDEIEKLDIVSVEVLEEVEDKIEEHMEDSEIIEEIEEVIEEEEALEEVFEDVEPITEETVVEVVTEMVGVMKDAPVPVLVLQKDLPVPVIFENVAAGETYSHAGLEITFKTLPEASTYLTITEITLSEAEIKALGALSEVAFDVTLKYAETGNDVENGDFSFDLVLPLPEDLDEEVEEIIEEDGVEVLYADSINELDEATKVSEDTDIVRDEVSVEGIDHLTLFLLSTGINEWETGGSVYDASQIANLQESDDDRVSKKWSDTVNDERYQEFTFGTAYTDDSEITGATVMVEVRRQANVDELEAYSWDGSAYVSLGTILPLDVAVDETFELVIPLEHIDTADEINNYKFQIRGGRVDASSGSRKTFTDMIRLNVSTADNPTLLTPADGTILSTADEGFDQTWTEVPYATAYNYRSCNDEDCTDIRWTADFTGTTKSVGTGVREGEFWWQVRAEFNDGEVSEWSDSFWMMIDNTDPEDPTTFTTYPEVGRLSSDNTVRILWSGATDNLSGVGGYSWIFTQDDSELPDTEIDGDDETAEITSEPLEDGEWYAIVRTVDKTETNWTETAVIGPFLLDSTKPTLTIDSHSGGEYENGDFVLGGMTDDDSGISEVRVRFRDMDTNALIETFFATFGAGNWSIDINDGGNEVEDGFYKIVVKSSDSADPKNAKFRSVEEITVDQTKPRGRVLVPETDSLWNQPIPVSGFAKDVTSGLSKVIVEYREAGSRDVWTEVDSLRFRNSTDRENWEIDDFEPSEDGEYEIRFRAYDAAGNEHTSRKNTFVYDTTKPMHEITSPESDSYQMSPITVSGISSDPGGSGIDSIRVRARDMDTNELLGTFWPSYNSLTGKWSITLDDREVSEGNRKFVVKALDEAGNHKFEKEINVVIDNTAPVITILGDNPATVNSPNEYIDAGATASDDVDGDITSKISTTSDVDYETPGEYSVTYKVSDRAGNTTEVTRTVKVIDVTAPVITILGENPIVVDEGSEYIDAGATATDETDGDITGDIVTTGEVNVNETGKYVITYTVKDSEGNETVAERTVTVNEPGTISGGGNPGGGSVLGASTFSGGNISGGGSVLGASTISGGGLASLYAELVEIYILLFVAGEDELAALILSVIQGLQQ